MLIACPEDYGNRVGAWRLLDLFAEFGFPCAMLLNSQLYHHCPELMAYADSLGHEVVGHSRTNSEWQVRLAGQLDKHLHTVHSPVCVSESLT